ncbi:MAG: hypothetical protein V1883_02760 [Candidatus Omnitrophota bacterium]
MAALLLFFSVFAYEKTAAESAPRNITVLVRVEPLLVLPLDQDSIEKELKAAERFKNKNYSLKAKDNTILYTITE